MALTFSACHRHNVGRPAVKEGIVQRQGATTYQYGSHLLKVDGQDDLVLSSKIVALDKYVGDQVIIGAVRNDNMVENGPPLYDVIEIKKVP